MRRSETFWHMIFWTQLPLTTATKALQVAHRRPKVTEVLRTYEDRLINV